MALFRSSNGVPFRIGDLRIPPSAPIDLAGDQLDAAQDAINSGMLISVKRGDTQADPAPVQESEDSERDEAPPQPKRKPGRPRKSETTAIDGAPETR